MRFFRRKHDDREALGTRIVTLREQLGWAQTGDPFLDALDSYFIYALDERRSYALGERLSEDPRAFWQQAFMGEILKAYPYLRKAWMERPK